MELLKSYHFTLCWMSREFILDSSRDYNCRVDRVGFTGDEKVWECVRVRRGIGWRRTMERALYTNGMRLKDHMVILERQRAVGMKAGSYVAEGVKIQHTTSGRLHMSMLTCSRVSYTARNTITSDKRLKKLVERTDELVKRMVGLYIACHLLYVDFGTHPPPGLGDCIFFPAVSVFCRIPAVRVLSK